MKKKEIFSSIIFIGFGGAFWLVFFTELAGLWTAVIIVAIVTILESCGCGATGYKKDAWIGLFVHIVGSCFYFAFMYLIARALWYDDPVIPVDYPPAPNYPFYDFYIEADLGHGEFIDVIQPAYIWWILVAIPAFRAIIIQPIILILAHIRNKKS